MNIQFKTKIDGNYKDIMRQFDRNLFEALKPSHADMEIVTFSGSKKGDEVHIRFHSPIKAEWISRITDDGENEKESFFIDEGVKLPFPLSYWKHKHIVQRITDDSSYIIDDITFKGSNFLLSFLLYPAIYAGFYPRGKIYKSYFNKK
ncbi:MAG: ligand-binding SRPBCC domain-containing protein [Saprospiraceae bacterium]|jgi:ligand-binding SRPBCC domain-containing protein